MALTKCRECNHEISDKAANCVNCGAKVKSGSSSALITILVLLVVILVVTASDQSQPMSEQQRLDIEQQTSDFRLARVGERLVRSTLNDGESARFRNLYIGTSKDGASALCGEVNAKNKLGAYVGFKKFITGGESRVDIQGESDLFDQLYGLFCNPVE